MPKIARSCISADAFFLPVPDEQSVLISVGGVLCSVREALDALALLEKSPGLMVRQPLERAGNSLASCDYHREAAPYRHQFYVRLACKGRGAAGRPATKHAFMHALRVRSSEAMERAPYAARQDYADEAYAAMGIDVAYVAAMAQMAVGVLEKRHLWRLRSDLKTAQVAAMRECAGHAGEFVCGNPGACGTGTCRFAQGVFADVTVIASAGKIPRPVNHTGSPFGLDASLTQLTQLMPFEVAAAV